MRNTKTPTNYTAIRRWMDHARNTVVKRAGERVLLSDGFMLTYIPYGALPETLLASESEARAWGTETPARGDPDAILAGLAQDAQVYLSRQLDCLNTVADTYHLLTDDAGNPVASISTAQVARVVADPFDEALLWRSHESDARDDGNHGGNTVSLWRGEQLLGVFMSLYDARAKVAFIVRRSPEHRRALTARGTDWDAVERAKGAAVGYDLLRMFDLSLPGVCERLAAIAERVRGDTWPSGFSEALAATLARAEP